jgi:hypothetical protein
MQLLDKFAYEQDEKAINFCRQAYQFLTEDLTELTTDLSKEPVKSPTTNTLPDGAYIIQSDGKAIHYKPNTEPAYEGCIGVGFKMGSKAIVVSLSDANERQDTTLTAKEDLTKNGLYIDEYSTASKYWNGKQNTEHLKAVGLANGIKLEPDWWVPSLAEMKFIELFKNEINEALTYVGGHVLAETWYWTSTEYSATRAWSLTLDNGRANNYSKAAYQGRVRPVSAFLL